MHSERGKKKTETEKGTSRTDGYRPARKHWTDPSHRAKCAIKYWKHSKSINKTASQRGMGKWAHVNFTPPPQPGPRKKQAGTPGLRETGPQSHSPPAVPSSRACQSFAAAHASIRIQIVRGGVVLFMRLPFWLFPFFYFTFFNIYSFMEFTRRRPELYSRKVYIKMQPYLT